MIRSLVAMDGEDDKKKILNDLIQLNNDRQLNYRIALDELNDEDDDVRILFVILAADCRQQIAKLKILLSDCEGSPETGFLNNGRIYKFWTNVKRNFTVLNRRTIISCCKKAEETALRAHHELLSNQNVCDYKDLIADRIQNIESVYRKLTEFFESHPQY